MTTDTKPACCCKIGCDAEAEFSIHTIRQGGGVAGPDIYADDTEACAEHVGELLGHQPDCHNPDEIEWIVVPLESRLDVWLTARQIDGGPYDRHPGADHLVGLANQARKVEP